MWVELVVPGEIAILFFQIESRRILRNGKYLGLVVFWLLRNLGFRSDVRCNYLIDIFELAGHISAFTISLVHVCELLSGNPTFQWTMHNLQICCLLEKKEKCKCHVSEVCRSYF